MAYRSWVKDIPGGQMMIRDFDNWWVEFWLRTDAEDMGIQNVNFGSGYDGSYHPFTSEFAFTKSRGWQRVGTAFVAARQFVLFRIDGPWWTGTGWMDVPPGALDFVQYIDRPLVPGPGLLAPPTLEARTPDAIRVSLNWGYDGGPDLGPYPILESEIWGSFDTEPRVIMHNTNDATFTGLSAKTKYYFWGRVRNEYGWGPLGYRAMYSTTGVPDQSQPPNVVTKSPTSVQAFWVPPDPYNGELPIVERQIAYGMHPVVATNWVSGTAPVITGLSMGKQYYFWARARNSIGWGPYSAARPVLLPAGAYVRSGATWKRAVPWVKVGGVWKMATPWTKAGGTWKKTR